MHKCPEHYQERITRAGGLNRYGEPNFTLAWSQTETMRSGGVWPQDHYAGYRQVYVANGSPYKPRQGYWMLMEWKTPEEYQGEATWEFLHRDDLTGLLTLGAFPRKGRYEKAVSLVDSELIDGKLVLHPWPLNSQVINLIIPTILSARKDSIKKRREFAAAEKVRADRKLDAQIEAALKDSKRPLIRQEAIDDRIRLMEKQWSAYLKNQPQIRRGVQQI